MESEMSELPWYTPEEGSKTEEDWNGRIDLLCEISSPILAGSKKTHFLP